MTRQTNSKKLFARATQILPGGVDSPVRAFKSVGGEPFFAQSAEGAYIVDVDGNRYVDYVGSWGPMIAGHAHPQVLAAVAETMRNGLSFGVPNALEVTMAERITGIVPSCEMVRMVNSGTEATIDIDRLTYVDQACLDLMLSWARQREAAGERTILDRPRLESLRYGPARHSASALARGEAPAKTVVA